jgi:RNA polymerase sigma factor (sigma-70 family)
MTSAEELLVIERVNRGDTDAFEELVLDNQKKVYNLALKMTGNENDALDLSQEAFLKAYTGLKNFRADSRFSVWMYRLTYNLCIDFIRKKQRTPSVSLTYMDDEGEAVDMDVPDVRYSPENEAERRELREEIAGGISKLPEKHSQILVMREITGMSYFDIAETLGINEGTVKSRLSRARQGLVNILNKNGTFSTDNRLNSSKEVDPLG